ncbi:unc-93 -like protein [Labeo rohita]|uniref:Protein unc-93 homolog A n=1 Tax=Labeo rohita TaxID=84645 RepID=A0A498LQ24_LABRO|nr:unc-93 -like protein [Labeo rohita]RXN23252.1 unc-93 -like protein [Labeo rohita]
MMKLMSRTTKNILVVSFGFLFLFTAFGGLQSLQSSLNAEDGMGVISLSVIYATIILSSMFLPPIMIKNLGCKWTIVISMGCYVAYSFGNLAPGWPSLMTTSAILGLGGSPLWSAKCTYLTISGNERGQKINKKGQDLINQYFGIFFFIFQSSAVWGNLMSSLIFGQDHSIAALTNLGCFVAFLYWKPQPGQMAVFFVFPALWGMADAVWQTQTNALYGVLFAKHKEAAFANYRMWESLGFVIAFAYSTYICLSIKIYICLSVLALTMVTYLYVEYNEYKNPTSQVTYDSEKTEKADFNEVNEKELNEKNVVAQTRL